MYDTSPAWAVCLESIQDRLESMYEIQITERINDFLVTDGKFLSDLGVDQQHRREQVLIQQQDDDIWMSLYLDSEVYEQVDQCSIPETLWAQNPIEFCLAAEGVSHFVYLCWNAQFTRQVTQLELELQAEVDKYLLLADCADNYSVRELHHWLFEACEFAAELSNEQRNRYVCANRYAGKYCRGLEHRYWYAGRRLEMLNELRRFYRKTQREKIRMIEILH